MDRSILVAVISGLDQALGFHEELKIFQRILLVVGNDLLRRVSRKFWNINQVKVPIDMIGTLRSTKHAIHYPQQYT